MSVLIGSFLVTPFTCYQATHLSHHARMATPADYELWPYCDPGYSRSFRRKFAVLDLLFPTMIGPFIYSRIFWTRDPQLSREDRRMVILEYLMSLVLWGGIISIGVLLSRLDLLSLEAGAIWWYAPLVLSGSLNTVRKFVEHVGLGSFDPMLGSRTVVPTNPLMRLISFANFEINVHGPHHRHGMAKHHELEEKLESQVKKTPEYNELVFRTVTGALRHTLWSVIRNPGVGEAVMSTSSQTNREPTTPNSVV